MRIIIEDDYNTICDWVTQYLTQKIKNFSPTKENPFILGLPTGSTPIGVYERLIQLYRNEKISFRNVVTFNMDEYVGLAATNENSYHYFMHHHFFDHIDIPVENINLLDGMAENLEQECINYEKKIKQYGKINFFLCGIGTDGHIAFNEPGSSLQSRTRVKTLCEDTIHSNKIHFDSRTSDIPRVALTVGIGTIMDAEEVLLMASGTNKAWAIQQCIEGSISNICTSSVFQMHPKATIICDDEATNELRVKHVKYYKGLQKHIDIMGQIITNPLLDYIKPDDKIVITSPHPDDDVIGMGGTLQLFPNKKNVTIAYLTSGTGGLHRNAPNMRNLEALSAVKVLGYNKQNLHFLTLPFYHTEQREISTSDSDIISSFLHKESPKHLFVCADKDPKETHHKCLTIIRDTILPPSVQFVWFYMSAWNTFDNYSLANCKVYFEKSKFYKKILSIALHHSQNPPKIHYGNPISFMEVAKKKDKSKEHFNYFKEQFYVVKVSEIKSAANHILTLKNNPVVNNG